MGKFSRIFALRPRGRRGRRPLRLISPGKKPAARQAAGVRVKKSSVGAGHRPAPTGVSLIIILVVIIVIVMIVVIVIIIVVVILVMIVVVIIILVVLVTVVIIALQDVL